MVWYGGIWMSGQMARKVRKDVNWKLILIIAASLLAIGCICAGLLACTPDENKGKAVIDDNVYVNSIYVGGLNAEEAKQKIEQTVNGEYFNKTVNVKYLGEASVLILKRLLLLMQRKLSRLHFRYPTRVRKQLFLFLSMLTKVSFLQSF